MNYRCCNSTVKQPKSHNHPPQPDSPSVWADPEVKATRESDNEQTTPSRYELVSHYELVPQ